MKKFAIGFGVILIAIVSLQVAGDQYRYELYDWAVDFETSKAHLERKSVLIGDESFSYLEGPKQAGQESIILLHGFGGSKDNWLRLGAFLTPSHHVVAFDLAGHGDNMPDMSKSYRLGSQVEFVRNMAAELGIDRFFLVGNSMGGAISSLYAASYPEQVLGLVLISPAGVHDIPSKMDELLAQGENPLIANSAEDFEALLDFVMVDKPYIPGPVLKVEAEKAMGRVAINQKIFTDIRQDLEAGMDDQIKTIKAPALFIWGLQDRAINVDNVKKYAGLIKNSQQLLLENIGHLAMVETPETTSLAMLDFISKI